MGGLSSDNNSFIGPYNFSCPLKKHEKDILGPMVLDNTLCSTLLNLSFVTSCSSIKILLISYIQVKLISHTITTYTKLIKNLPANHHQY
jgi:hypothetical protein